MKQYKNNKGLFCGWLSNDGIYRKDVDSKKHKMKIMDAYAIDKRIVDDIRADCMEIRIREDGTNILSISMADFLEHAVVRNFDSEQYFVSIKYFTQKNG